MSFSDTYYSAPDTPHQGTIVIVVVGGKGKSIIIIIIILAEVLFVFHDTLSVAVDFSQKGWRAVCGWYLLLMLLI